jgi:hypothetical protein
LKKLLFTILTTTGINKPVPDLSAEEHEKANIDKRQDKSAVCLKLRILRLGHVVCFLKVCQTGTGSIGG